jgi:hypothetical protein
MYSRRDGDLKVVKYSTVFFFLSSNDAKIKQRKKACVLCVESVESQDSRAGDGRAQLAACVSFTLTHVRFLKRVLKR